MKDREVRLAVEGDLEPGLGRTAGEPEQPAVTQWTASGQHMPAANRTVGAGKEGMAMHKGPVVAVQADNGAAAKEDKRAVERPGAGMGRRPPAARVGPAGHEGDATEVATQKDHPRLSDAQSR